MHSRKTTKIDYLIGENIRSAREFRGYSRVDFAATIGMSHQQVEKYESGTNRISAGTLNLVAEILEQPVEWFFDPHETDWDSQEGA